MRLNSSSVVRRPRLNTPRHRDREGSSLSPKWRVFLYLVGETDRDFRFPRLPERLERRSRLPRERLRDRELLLDRPRRLSSGDDDSDRRLLLLRLRLEDRDRLLDNSRELGIFVDLPV